MSRSTVFCLLFSATFLLLLTGCTLRPSGPDRLLFVVPEQLPDGQSSAGQLLDFEEWMAFRAGGFTRVNGVEGGWIDSDGLLQRESNVLYLLSLPHGINADSFQSEVEAKILYDFQQREAWIQRW